MPSSSDASSSEGSSSSAPSREELDPMDEPMLGKQYYLNHIGDIYNTWGSYRGRGVTIAVIDVGFNVNHPEFEYADGTSKVSPLSASFVTKKEDGKWVTRTEVGKDKAMNMGESHGTFCAGVAAAAANGKGTVGVAPEAELMLLKTDCKPKSIVAAFNHARTNGAKVITISLGSYYDYGGDLIDDDSDLATVYNRPIKDCYDSGIVVCSAAGNGGLDGKPTEYTFPGCVDHVIGVGGLAGNSSSEIWEGSSYNSSSKYQFCDVFAPADWMYGCCNYGGKDYDGGPEDGHGKWRGTSFASPIVAGMAALYFEANPNNGAADFEKALFDSCHAITTSTIATKDQLGYGRVDVGALLGTSSKAKVRALAKVPSSWTSCYAYTWNSTTGQGPVAWPGTALNLSNGTYSITVDTAKYDCIIFNNGVHQDPRDNEQSADLLAASFLGGHTLDLSSRQGENGYLVGRYIQG